MQTHRTNVRITEAHEVLVRLPDDFPAGDAEVIILARGKTEGGARDRLARLDEWIRSLPPAPKVSASAFDRGELYR